MQLTVFAVLLLVAAWTGVTAQANGPLASCCQRIKNTVIPVDRIVSYLHQDVGLCPFKAVRFTTIRGRGLCWDPESSWAKFVQCVVDKRKITSRAEEICRGTVYWTTPSTTTPANSFTISTEPLSTTPTKYSTTPTKSSSTTSTESSSTTPTESSSTTSTESSSTTSTESSSTTSTESSSTTPTKSSSTTSTESSSTTSTESSSTTSTESFSTTSTESSSTTPTEPSSTTPTEPASTSPTKSSMIPTPVSATSKEMLGAATNVPKENRIETVTTDKPQVTSDSQKKNFSWASAEKSLVEDVDRSESSQLPSKNQSAEISKRKKTPRKESARADEAETLSSVVNGRTLNQNRFCVITGET